MQEPIFLELKFVPRVNFKIIVTLGRPKEMYFAEWLPSKTRTILDDQVSYLYGDRSKAFYLRHTLHKGLTHSATCPKPHSQYYLKNKNLLLQLLATNYAWLAPKCQHGFQFHLAIDLPHPLLNKVKWRFPDDFDTAADDLLVYYSNLFTLHFYFSLKQVQRYLLFHLH